MAHGTTASIVFDQLGCLPERLLASSRWHRKRVSSFAPGATAPDHLHLFLHYRCGSTLLVMLIVEHWQKELVEPGTAGMESYMKSF